MAEQSPNTNTVKQLAIRHWGIIAAVLVAAFGAPIIWTQLKPGAPTLPRFKYENARPSDYQPGGSACSPKALAAISNQNRRIRQADTCAEEAEQHRLNSNDLIQQTRAANAAEAQAQLAYQAAWVNLFQTLGGFFTLIAAIAAAAYARQAARAARDALEHDRSVYKSTNRPYLVIRRIRIRPTEYDGIFKITACIRNFGGTIAKNVTVKTGATLEKFPVVEGFKPPLEEMHGAIPFIPPNAPQDNTAYFTIDISSIQRKEVLEYQSGVFITVSATYIPWPEAPPETVEITTVATGPKFFEGRCPLPNAWQYDASLFQPELDLEGENPSPE